MIRLKSAVLPLVVLALSLASCQKSTDMLNPVKKDGGDLDEPIVIGTVLKGQQVPVNSAFVEAFQSGSTEVNASTTADEHGDFILTVTEPGNYYFKAYEGTTLLTTTSVIEVADTVYYDIEQ
jgi:hypothetical protein